MHREGKKDMRGWTLMASRPYKGTVVCLDSWCHGLNVPAFREQRC